jgi:hypothetical protein
MAGLLGLGLVGALGTLRSGEGFDLAGPVLAILRPTTLQDGLSAAGVLVLAVLGGVAMAAIVVARRGLVPPRKPGMDPSDQA